MSSRFFRNLQPGDVLLLPNAWDAISARLIESLGARAIATTSAGLAWAHGYPDGNSIPEDRLTAAIRDMARVISVPLTVDVEAGYSEDPRAVVRLVTRIVTAGAVGINIEDGTGSAELLCNKIAAIRENTAHSGTDLFINARTDVYLRDLASGEAAIEETLRRAARYRAAGCDGLFVPGLTAIDAIAAIAAAVAPMPLNILAVPNLPSLDALQRCGVRRLSAGSSLAQAALGCTRHLVSGFLSGSMSELFDGCLDYQAANQLLSVKGSG